MPKSVKAVKNARSRRTFRNKKSQNKKLKEKFKRKIGKPTGTHILAPIWDKKKSLNANMRAAGLVLDPNKLIKLRLYDETPEAMDIEEALSNPGAVVRQEKKIRTKKAKGYAKEIEKKASLAMECQADRPPPRLSATDLQFCELMVKKHGLDYEAMARDHDNIYQNTAKQFERKIKTFKRSKAYHEVAGQHMEE